MDDLNEGVSALDGGSQVFSPKLSGKSYPRISPGEPFDRIYMEAGRISDIDEAISDLCDNLHFRRGCCSCSCFHPLQLNPHVMYLIDQVVVALLQLAFGELENPDAGGIVIAPGAVMFDRIVQLVEQCFLIAGEPLSLGAFFKIRTAEKEGEQGE